MGPEAYVVVAAVALAVSALTLFSGFGLGTLLMPAFALFFPVPVAIAATAVVHLANNLFKAVLVGRWADWGVVAGFGIPAALGALGGAAALESVSGLAPLAAYSLAGREHEVSPVKLVVAAVMAAFAVLEMSPRFQRLAFDRRYLVPGGLVSGFFGGLSGHQGALRSAFLAKAGLGKEAFVGTGVAAAVIVDVVRLVVYGTTGAGALAPGTHGLVAVATLAAFAGAFAGARLLARVTFVAVQRIVGVLLLLIAAGLAAGLL